MQIGILTFRGKDYHPNMRLIQEASKLGHHVVLLNPKACFSSLVKPPYQVSCDSPDRRIHVLIPRVGAGIDDYTLGLVRHFELMGVRVINGSSAIEKARDKFRSLQELAGKGIEVVESCYVNNAENLKEAVEHLGGYPVVLKMKSSRQGRGVTLLSSEEAALFIVENLREPGLGIILQRFYPNEGREDVRILVVGKEAVAAAIMKPKEGEFRSNVHLGGKGAAIDPDPGLKSLAVRATKALGLEVAGVDLVVTGTGRAMVMEVNYAPGFRGLESATGTNVGASIIRYVEKCCGEV